MKRSIISLIVVVLGIMVIVINFVDNPEKARILFMEMDNWTFRAIWAVFVVYSGYNFYRSIKKK
ncbi:MAG: hypothetical protein N4A72_06590 [Bacteroidales bacterium]|jgi:uncharacterized membrane protein|nr:hypothetical protein [Bacteroidales bacterium]